MNISANNTIENNKAETQNVLWQQPLSGYDIVECLSGTEAYGVFLARDTRLDRDVIIKSLTADLKNNEDAVERFFNEARQVARLKHNNLIRGIDVGRVGDLFYFISEYTRGESLKDKLLRLQTGKIREIESLRIIQEVATGLDYILSCGLVHRDIKPANILLTNNGEIKITDFGIAKDVAYASEKDMLLREPNYIAPERAQGESNIDIRADLYSLGCIWFHTLLGKAPFNCDNPEISLKKHITDDPDSVNKVDPKITPATAQLISWLLKKDREMRPRTPKKFLAKLMTHPIIKLQQKPSEDY